MVRMWKERKPARGTHLLERVEDWTGQDMERMQASKRHSLARDAEDRWSWSTSGCNSS